MGLRYNKLIKKKIGNIKDLKSLLIPYTCIFMVYIYIYIYICSVNI